MKSLLTIAGTDPSGGAGIPVDLQVFRDLGFHGLSVVSAIVCQNTAKVSRFEPVSARLLADQLDVLLRDITPAGVKIGMIPVAELVEVVAEAIVSLRGRLKGARCPVVFDPVMASSSRHELAQPDAVEAMRVSLIPLVDVLTPNVDEATALLGSKIESRADFEGAARELLGLGCGSVLLKAGHLPEQRAERAIADVLATPAGLHWLAQLPTIDADVRGTGCQLSSAVCATLARGEPLVDAVERARRYLNDLLHTQRRDMGRGCPLIVRAAPSEFL